jgi:flagellar hook-length control protein FliK
LINNLLQSQMVAVETSSGSDSQPSADSSPGTQVALPAKTGSAPQGLIAGLEETKLPAPAAVPESPAQPPAVPQTPAAASIPDNSTTPESQKITTTAASDVELVVPPIPVAAAVAIVATTTTEIVETLTPPRSGTGPVSSSPKPAAPAGKTSSPDTTSTTPPEAVNVTIVPATAAIAVQSATSVTATVDPPNPLPQDRQPAASASNSEGGQPTKLVTPAGAANTPVAATSSVPAAVLSPPTVPPAPANFGSVADVAVTSSAVPAPPVSDATDSRSGNQNFTSADSQATPGQAANQNPGFLPFAAAPSSLQLNPTSPATGQQAAAAPLNPAQVVEQVSYALQLTHTSGQQLQMQLNPPQLGALQVDVSVRDGVLSARLETQTPATQQILVDNLSQLKDSLTQQGVSFDRIEVRLAASGSGFGGSGSTDPSFAQQQQDAGLPWEYQPAATDVADPVSPPPAPGRMDLRKPLTSLDVMI